PVPTLHVNFSKALIERFITGYQNDPQFAKIYLSSPTATDRWDPNQRFFKETNGLLYFRDADYVARLCVPRSLRWEIIKEAHENPMEATH
ncbi:hypothetical protein BDZ89DRAFT_910303, partial [Hymenopellis radicata]